MRATFFKGSVVGGVAGTLMAAATVAVAGNGIGGVFNLGVSNTVDANTELRGNVASPNPQLRVVNTGSGPAVQGESSGTTAGYGVYGKGRYGVVGSGNYSGVWAESTGTNANLATGVYGQSGVGKGVFGKSTSGFGVYGQSSSSNGVYGKSSKGPGVQGESSGTTAGYGVYGKGRYGVVGSGNYSGVWAESTGTDPNLATGVYGQSAVGKGVFGKSTSGFGVYGESSTHHAVHGQSNSSTGVRGVSTTGVGVHGTSNSLTAVFGDSGTGIGVHGKGSTGVVGESAGGWAFDALGNARQDRAANGWVKAMVKFDPAITNDKIQQCYNSQLPPAQATAGNCGITLVYHDLGNVRLDLGFGVNDRLLALTVDNFAGPGISGSVDVSSDEPTRVTVWTWYTDSRDSTNSSFYLIVY
jgi:hypothetical protein